MDVVDYQAIREKELQETVIIFNPLSYDFTWNYDGVPYTIPSRENARFKKHIALHLGKHIKDAYLSNEKLPNEVVEHRAHTLIFDHA